MEDKDQVSKARGFLNRRDVAYVMLFSISCAFLSVFAWTVRTCMWTTDPYAVSPLGSEAIVLDIFTALVLGPVVAVLAICIGAIGFRLSRSQRLADRRFFTLLAVCYAISTVYFCINPAGLGACRIDM